MLQILHLLLPQWRKLLQSRLFQASLRSILPLVKRFTLTAMQAVV
jgi:hypothetical protein